MVRNYFKIAWRNLLRYKGFAVTNLLGLTIGMTCTIFILFWVRDELAYDKFHKNYDQVHKVLANRDFNNQVFTDPNMVLPLAKTIESEIPEVQNATVITYPQQRILAYGDTQLKKEGYTVNEKFFTVFSWKFIEGNAAGAIADPSSIVLLLLISTDFLRLVLIAFCVAVPLVWWGMHQWLQNYTYHIDISIWVFIGVGAMVLLLTMIVVSLNTIRAAVANPVESLRTE